MLRVVEWLKPLTLLASVPEVVGSNPTLNRLSGTPSASNDDVPDWMFPMGFDPPPIGVKSPPNRPKIPPVEVGKVPEVDPVDIVVE